MWREAAPTREDARARFDTLAKSESAVKYVIRSQRTGHTLTINYDEQGISEDRRLEPGRWAKAQAAKAWNVGQR